MDKETVVKSYATTLTPGGDAQEKKLYLLVTDSGNEICSVQLPLATVEDLEALFPAHVAQNLSLQMPVDMKELGKRVVESNFLPQSIIDQRLGERRYEVWVQ